MLNGVSDSQAAPVKSLIEIIDRYLTVYKLNADQADEALSLPPGTVTKALSFGLPAEPKPAEDEIVLDLTLDERKPK